MLLFIVKHELNIKLACALDIPRVLREEMLLDINLAFEDDEFLLVRGAAELAVHELEDCLKLVSELLNIDVRAHQL